MVQYLYEEEILMYAIAGLGGLGLLVRSIVNLVYKGLVKESDNMGTTKHKSLKHMKMKFETCYKLKIGVNNVDTFVDKSLLRNKFGGFLLSTWDNFCGQVLYFILLLVPVATVIGVISDIDQHLILSTGAVGIASSAILIIVDKSINLYSKKSIIRYNILDYLENFCKVRLEQEAFHPEILEQYRKEYFELVGADGESAAAIAVKTEAVKKEEPKDEVNRRREAKQKKELEKRALAQKREEEQKRLEVIRREEEKRRQEERKMLAAKRREEERQKLEEEREALEARRLEAKKKAEEKKAANLRKLQETEQEQVKDGEVTVSQNTVSSSDELNDIKVNDIKVNDTKSNDIRANDIKANNIKSNDIKSNVNEQEIIHTINNSTNNSKEKENKKRVLEVVRLGAEEVAAATGTNETIKQELPVSKKKSRVKPKPMSPEEEKLVEDVLKQFFA